MIGLKQVKTWAQKWQDETIELHKNGLSMEEAREQVAVKLSSMGLIDDQGFFIECKPQNKAPKKTKSKKPDVIRTGKRTDHEAGRRATVIINENAFEEVDKDITFDELISRIRAAIDSYNNMIGMTLDDWRTKGKPQQWRGLCMAVGKIFKANRGLLKQSIKYDGVKMPTNNNAYDYNGKLSLLFDYYKELCSYVGLPCKYRDFGLFAGIDFQSLENWSVPTSAGFDFYKKAMAEQADSIAGCAEGSRIVSVVGLARLNAFHGWTKTSEVIHNAGGAVTPTAALPHFDAPALENKGF